MAQNFLERRKKEFSPSESKYAYFKNIERLSLDIFTDLKCNIFKT